VIEYEEREYGFEKIVNLQPIGSNDFRVAAFTWEMCIAENDFVVMSHAIHGFE
jgi:hypothetical protein